MIPLFAMLVATAPTFAPSSAGTAYTLQEGAKEVGVFQPVRVGMGETWQLEVHPLVAVLAPNLAVKKRWLDLGFGVLSSRHGLSYPTGLIHALAREGVGGIWPRDTRIPHIVALSNDAYLSVPVLGEHVLTAKLRGVVALRVGSTTFDALDLPVAFVRTAPWHRGWTVGAGLDWHGVIAGDLSFQVDADAYLLPYAEARWAAEQSGLLTYAFTHGFRISAGYLLVVGRYRYRATDVHVLPLADAVWRFD